MATPGPSRAAMFLEQQGMGKLSAQLARLSVYEVTELKDVSQDQLSSILGLTSPQQDSLAKALENEAVMAKARLAESEGIASLAHTCVVVSPKAALAATALAPLGLEAMAAPLSDMGVKVAGDLADLDPDSWGPPAMRAKVGKGAEARWHALMTAVALEATRVTMAARWRRVKQAAKVVEAFRLQGHAGPIWGLAVSADGRVLASASADDSVRLWQITDQARLKDGASVVVSLKEKGARQVALTWDGALVVVGTERGQIKVYDAANLKLKRSWDALKAGLCGDEDEDYDDEAFTDVDLAGMAVSGDARWVAAVFRQPGAAKVFELASGKLAFALPGHKGDVNGCAFGPDHHTLVTGCSDKLVRVWDTRQGARVAELAGHTGAVMAVAVTRDGKYVLSAGADKSVRVWAMDSIGKGGAAAAAHVLTGHSELIRSLVITPDGTAAMTGSDDATLAIWDLAGPSGGPGRPLAPALATTVKNVHSGRDHSKITALVLTPDGRTLISGGRDNGIIRLWRVATEEGSRDLRAAAGSSSMTRASGSGAMPGRSLSGAGATSAKW